MQSRIALLLNQEWTSGNEPQWPGVHSWNLAPHAKPRLIRGFVASPAQQRAAGADTALQAARAARQHVRTS